VNSKVISSALNLALAQRLVRTLCEACKQEVVLAGKDKETVERVMSGITDPAYIEGLQREKVWVPSPTGCPACNGLGYKGRVGVYEAILMDENIEKVVNENPSERDIRAAAASQKLLTLAEDGVIKALQGKTSLEELDRVIDLSV
jgi:type II secretory ATPase GspE/PulE/Tfp pilus assembly ATPase PilB-like protein